MKFELNRVYYMPKEIKPGILYVSEEFGTAAHLCACGCGSKVRTPLSPTEWSIQLTAEGPSLNPSIGNWQLNCRSHYWIRHGEVVWCEKWSREQIVAGRNIENERRRSYYENYYRNRVSFLIKTWRWIKKLFAR